MQVQVEEALGDRMKRYEASSKSFVDHNSPVIMRLDGHCFSKFTRGLKKPYEEWLHKLMVKITAQLVEDYSAVVGYTQSDEITLVFVPQVLEGVNQPYMFANQVQKLVSLAAANATNMFTSELIHSVVSGKIKQEDYKPEVYKKLAVPRAYFDARIFNVPSLTECYNNLFWRSTYDCIRNSVSMTAQCEFSSKSLQNLNRKQLLQKLKDEKGIDWETLDPEFKYGTFIKKRIVMKPMENVYKGKEAKKEEGKEVESENGVKEVKEEGDEKNGVTMVQRRKLCAFALHLPKLEEKVEEFLFSKYYQEDNEEMKKLICKEYIVE